VAALPLGTIMVLVACGALGWGTYTLLSTLHVFEILSSQSWTPNWTAIGAMGGGALLAFIAHGIGAITPAPGEELPELLHEWDGLLGH